MCLFPFILLGFGSKKLGGQTSPPSLTLLLDLGLDPNLVFSLLIECTILLRQENDATLDSVTSFIFILWSWTLLHENPWVQYFVANQ